MAGPCQDVGSDGARVSRSGRAVLAGPGILAFDLVATQEPAAGVDRDRPPEVFVVGEHDEERVVTRVQPAHKSYEVGVVGIGDVLTASASA